MKRIWFKYRFLLLTVLIYSCVDPISFETDIESGQVVFYGHFSQLSQDHTIDILRTSEFGVLPDRVSGACIKIIDDSGNSADYQEVEPGKYLLAAGKIQGYPGRSYHVEIMLADGKTYLSQPQKMPEPVSADTIYFEIGRREILEGNGSLVEKTLLDVFVDTPLKTGSEETSHLRWTVDEVYSFVDLACGPGDNADQCYFISPVKESEILLFENEGNTQDYLNRFKVRTRELVPYDEFTARHYFLVNQFTISTEELEYWKKIEAVANQSGSLFDVQPAGVPGNIFEKGNELALTLGYFSVSGQNALRIFTTPHSIRPNPVFDCTDQSFFNNNVPECCFCFLKEGILIERPAYWDED